MLIKNGSLKRTSAPVAVPAVLSVPTAPTGPKTAGQTLTGNAGVWSNSPTSYARKWQTATDGAGTGAADVAGQTGSTYSPVVGDVGKYVRSGSLASNGIGPAVGYSFSPWIGPIAAALAVSGVPGTTANVGTAYSFTPGITGGHPGANPWTIVNKPAWATFSTATGQLSGTPTATGVDSGIVISATDADGITASLASFSITTSAALVGLTLDWSQTANTGLLASLGYL